MFRLIHTPPTPTRILTELSLFANPATVVHTNYTVHLEATKQALIDVVNNESIDISAYATETATFIEEFFGWEDIPVPSTIEELIDLLESLPN